MIPKVIVLSGYGLNGEEEMKHGFVLAGATVEIVHINDLIDGEKSLDDYDILAIPGGFSYGDHTGGGKAYANRITNNLGDAIHKFVKRNTLTFGICNGFQILVQLGFLPALDKNYGTRQAALIHNSSQRYQCEWIKVKAKGSKCIFTQGIDILDLPIGHGEGNFYMPEEQLQKLEDAGQITLRYCKADGSAAGGQAPWNPNGAAHDIAGICDPSGRIFGLMPHPDRSLFFTNRADWTRKKAALLAAGMEIPTEGPGMAIYRNAVDYFS
jgi:phosphoribosylformylglycinamidine synthase I